MPDQEAIDALADEMWNEFAAAAIANPESYLAEFHGRDWRGAMRLRVLRVARSLNSRGFDIVRKE